MKRTDFMGLAQLIQEKISRVDEILETDCELLIEKSRTGCVSDNEGCDRGSKSRRCHTDPLFPEDRLPWLF